MTLGYECTPIWHDNAIVPCKQKSDMLVKVHHEDKVTQDSGVIQTSGQHFFDVSGYRFHNVFIRVYHSISFGQVNSTVKKVKRLFKANWGILPIFALYN